jgi:hypothetical protein
MAKLPHLSVSLMIGQRLIRYREKTLIAGRDVLLPVTCVD